jgi:hypothetical protein
MERRDKRDKTNRKGETNNGSNHRRVGTGRVRPNSDNERDFSQSYSRYRNYERTNHRNQPNDKRLQPINSNSNENLFKNLFKSLQ